MIQSTQHWDGLKGTKVSSRMKRPAKVILSFSFSFCFFFAASAQNRNYCSYDDLAQTGRYKICTPKNQTNQHSFNANVGIKVGPISPSAGYTYTNSSETRNWNCKRQMPVNGQVYYIDDRRKNMKTNPQIYNGY